MFRRFALVSIVFGLISASYSEDNFDSNCKYNDDMCKIDPEICIRKMREELTLIKTCSGLYYGSGRLYDDRKEIVNFHITIDEEERNLYPDQLTYTIVRKTAAKIDWSVPDSVSRIDNCCSMNMNDTCTLPTKGPDDHLFAFFPLKQDKDKDHWYCQYRLEEPISPELKWCETEDEIGCASYEKGNVVVKTISEPLSISRMSGNLDYCYFSTAEKYLAPNGRNSFKADNITAEVSGEKISAQLPGGENCTCDLRKGIRPDNVEDTSEEYHEESSDFVCYFIRPLNNRWISQPHCLNVKIRIDGKRSGKNLVAITIMSSLLACAVVLMGIVCLIRKMKNCLRKIQFNMPYHIPRFANNNVETTASNEAQPIEEIVNEIKFSAVNQDHIALEVENGAPYVKETDDLSLNIEKEEATLLLCHENHESAGQSDPVSEISEVSNRTLNNSGIQYLASTSGFNEHEDMMNSGSAANDNSVREICKDNFPDYVMKDFRSWPRAQHPL